MRIAHGTTAPTWRATDIDGNVLGDRVLRGRPYWLAFYRFASCPLCNMRVHEVVGMQPRWDDLGLRVIAVFQSPPEHLRELVALHGAEFSVVADPERRLFDTFRLERSWRGAIHPRAARRLARARRVERPDTPRTGPNDQIPGDFVVGPHGSVTLAHYGSHIGDHAPFSAIEDAVDEPSSEVALGARV